MRDTSIDELYNRFDSWFKEELEDEVNKLGTPCKETIKTFTKIAWLNGAYVQKELEDKQ